MPRSSWCGLAFPSALLDIRWSHCKRLTSQGVPLKNLRASLSCPCLLVAALSLTISATSVRAEDRVLRIGKPEQVGMSGAGLELVNQILTEETKSGRVTAASVLVARHRRLARRLGYAGPGADSPKAGPETVYLLSSITKLVTATALMLLVERGQVSLTDTVQK
jgi:CubicO group peptidase (beta-lactamase class C family)